MQIYDGREDRLNLVVEIKGYRGEDAKKKANAIQTFWIPGVNNLGSYGRWHFAEFTRVFEIEAEFYELVNELVNKPAEVSRRRD